ncbi:MAG: cobalamin-binding protein [Pseudomonadota bacterium]
MRRWVLAICIAAVMVACGGDEADSPERAAPADIRIVTLAPHLAEIVFAAGAGESLVGVSAYSDYPEAVEALPIVSDGFQLNAEALLAVGPTVILAWGGGGQSRMRELAASLEIPLVEIAGRRLQDIALAIRQVGEIAGTSSVAETAAQQFERSLENLEGAAEPLTVFYQIGQQPLYTVGGQHFIADLIALCGGVNAFADLSEAAPSIAVEAVVAADPDVILTTEGGVDGAIVLWSKWPSLTAVSEGQILGVPGDLVNRPGPRLAQGAAAVCEALRSASI